MSDSQTVTKKVVRDLEKNLKEMPKNLRLFSMSMLSLYYDKNPGTSTDISRKFTKLRDDTRQDTEVYLKVILPLTTKLVCAIKDFFEYYDALSYEEWCDALPDILEAIKANKDLADTVLKMYHEIIYPLKKREEEAMVILTEFKNLQTTYENETKDLEAKAKTKRNWAYAFACIPILNLTATPALLLFSNQDKAKSIAARQQSKIHKDAAAVVAETLIPALGNFIEGLTKAAGFFKAIEFEINSFEGKGKEIKESHYKIIKDKVRKINPSCYEFYAAIPATRTDFESIPDGDTQQNYVEKWLMEKVKEIQEKRESTRKNFWDVVKAIRFGSPNPIMASSSSIETAEMSSDEEAYEVVLHTDK